MQPTQQPLPLSTFQPGTRQLDIEDYIDIIRRRKGWIAGPALLGLVLGVVVAYAWPDTYLSEATIRSVPPVLPRSLIQDINNIDLTQRIMQMTQQVKSRDALSNMIEKHKLYVEQRAKLPLLDVLEQMRKDVSIAPLGIAHGGRAGSMLYRISFEYGDRHKARAVVDDLVTYLVDENTRKRTEEVNLNVQFIKDQRDSAKRALEQLEGKLSAFRTQNMVAMPEQVSVQLQQVGATEGRIANLNQQISRIAQERTLMEGELRQLKSRREALQPPAPERVEVARNDQKVRELTDAIERLDTTVAGMRERLNDAHPDLQAALQRRATLVRLREQADRSEGTAPPGNSRTLPVPRALMEQYQREVQNLEDDIARRQAVLAAKTLEEQGYRRDIQAGEASVRQVQGRLQGTPGVQQEFLALMRDRDLASQTYTELSQKLEMSNQAADAQNQAKGETLETVDRATLPVTPKAPVRGMIVGIGAAIGIALGAGLAFLNEMKNSSLKNLKDVRAYTQLTVLGCVPLLENDLVVRRRRRLGWLAWSAACLLSVMVMSGSAYYYYFVKAA